MHSNKMIPRITRQYFQNFGLFNTQCYSNKIVPMGHSKMRPRVTRQSFQNSLLLNRHCYSTNIVPKDSSKMRPRVVKHDFKQDFRVNFNFFSIFEHDESKTLIGFKDTHAFISHNLGISWKQIDGVSGTELQMTSYGRESIVILDENTGRLYFLDDKGNLAKECVFKPEKIEPDSIMESLHSDDTYLWEQCNFEQCNFEPGKINSYDSVSLHPNDPNVMLLETCQRNINGKLDDLVTQYYTKDGGVSGFEVFNRYILEDTDYGTGRYTYDFITGGARDLIYEYNDDCDGYIGYALNFFSDSPLKLTYFPFTVKQTQDIFYGIKDGEEFHVSEDGVNFEHIKFPSQSPPYEFEKYIKFLEISDRIALYHGYNGSSKSGRKRRKGSFFLHGKYYNFYKRFPPCPLWITLFRYDVKRKEIKVMLDYCYDYLVVSAEEGIVIANYVTNPQGCIGDKEEPQLRTVITYNDGATWEPMTGPSGAELSVKIPHSLEHSWGDEPSNTSMMIVCGKELPIENCKNGYFTPFDDTSLSTYMTKDSGRSWRKLNDDIMTWMIGGGDNIIVMGQDGNEHILYSLDCGTTWNKLEIGVPFPTWRNQCSSSSDSKRFWLGNCSISFDPADQIEQ